MDLKDFHIKQIGIFSKLNAEKQAELSASLNQFYQDRIEKLRTRLWGTLTWLAAAQGAALLLTIKQGGLRAEPVRAFTMEEPLLVLLAACFGLILAFYMLAIIWNGQAHLARNFENSDFALNLPYIAPPAPASAVVSPSADDLCEARRKAWAAGEKKVLCASKTKPSSWFRRLLLEIMRILALPAGGLGMELPFRTMWILALAAGVLDLLLMILAGVDVWEWFSGKDVPNILITPAADTSF
jgi:hypothetical protein